MPLWALLPIMLGTIAADWTVMVLVGRRLGKSLTIVAQQAVTDGAEDVKNHLFTLVPLMIPTVVGALRSELAKVSRETEPVDVT